MKITPRRAGAIGLGLALVVGVGGIASAVDLGWYSGGNASVVDPDRSAVPLKIYDAAGTPVTSGSTTAPIGAFVAADGVVRAGDTYASAFLYRPDSGAAPGAWTGVQATGTTKSDATHPATLDGKPFVSTAGGSTIAEFASAYPATASTGDFKDVYELRLRTSSPTGGVSEKYASAFVKVTGSTWAITAAPLTGGPTTPPTTPPTTTPTNPPPTTNPVVSRIAPGKPTIAFTKKPTAKKKGNATVTVKTPAGRPKATGKVTITIKKGSKSKKITVSLSGGKKSVSIPKLPKGTYKVTVAYAGDSHYTAATSKTVSLKVKK